MTEQRSNAVSPGDIPTIDPMNRASDNHPVSSLESGQICPKCGHTQPFADECTRCGVIFAQIPSSESDEHATSLGPPPITYYDLAKERKQWVLLAVLLAILSGLLYWIVSTSDIRHPPGILAPEEPRQVTIHNPEPWRRGNRVVVPLAHFSLQARVLSTERYRFDNFADLSPIDLALGWGPMSDQRILDQLEIAQDNRFYAVVSLDGKPPLPMGVLLAKSSNMHMLPANDNIKDRLLSLRRGNIIELTGYLVGVQENGRWVWISSLSRTDTGNGACEIVWVADLKVR